MRVNDMVERIDAMTSDDVTVLATTPHGSYLFAVVGVELSDSNDVVLRLQPIDKPS